MNYLPFVIVLVLLAGMLLLSARNRRRQVADEAGRAERITVGTEVMTTSGLYGTVVAMNGDGSVQLSIAAGVEVKWAVAALRDAASLSDDYRRGLTEADDADRADQSTAPDDPQLRLRKTGGEAAAS